MIVISIDGQIVTGDEASISILDSGLLSGYGVFETMLAEGDLVFRLGEHLARFEKSCLALGLIPKYSSNQIEEFIGEALGRNQDGYKRIRVMLTGGNSGDGLWGDESIDNRLVIIVREHSLSRGIVRPKAEVVYSATSLHWLAKHKTLSRMLYSHPTPEFAQVRGKNSKSLQILYHPSIGVTEFSSASLFVRQSENVVTAFSEDVFLGICRAEIIKNWRALVPEFKLEIRKVELSDLFAADEVIGVNSLRGAFAVSELNDNTGESFASTNPISYSKPVLSLKLHDFLLTR